MFLINFFSLHIYNFIKGTFEILLNFKDDFISPFFTYYNFDFFSYFNFYFKINFLGFNSNELNYDIFFLSIFNSFGIIVVISILLLLLHNMLSYSLKYYITKFFFSLKKNFDFTTKNLLIDLFVICNFRVKSLHIVNKIADTTFSCFVLSLFLILYYYFNNIFFFKKNVTFVTTGGKDYFSQNNDIISWISYDLDTINLGIVIDSLSLIMLVIVLSVSTLVHYYSLDYMYSDPRLITFMKYLSGFTSAMVILIVANNLALVFMGWEGVGIFSYLLIGFWYTRTLALKASLKAVIVNKIGDVALLIGMSLCLYYFGTTEFVKLYYLVSYLIENKNFDIFINFYFFKVSLFTLISFFLLIAAVGKSAQFGLHTWLPDAMEGPTPVSALIHAATMVTAGVYLIA